MKITKTDKKLLSALYFNTRKTNLQLSKEIKLSRQQIATKIKKFKEKGLINFISLLDYSKIGYNYRITLMLKINIDKEKILEKIPKENMMSYGLMLGKYDLFVNMIFKNEEEFTKKMFELLNSNLIKEVDILKPLYYEQYPLKFLGNQTYEGEIKIEVKKQEIYKLDNKEKQILKLLSKDSRMKVIDIALKLNLSSELVLYKFKKLIQEKIIALNKTFFNMEKFGFNYSIIQIKFENLDNETINKIKKYSKESKFVDSYGIVNNTKFNCFIQYFHENHNQLREELIKFKQIFGNKLQYEILLLEEEKGINTIPFL